MEVDRLVEGWLGDAEDLLVLAHALVWGDCWASVDELVLVGGLV